ELIGGTSLFRLVRTREAAQLFQRLGEAGILVRRFAEYPAWLRFGLPDRESAWQRLAAALPPKAGRLDKRRSVRPAAGVLLRGFEAPLRLFGQEPCDHPHGELDGNFARAALLELLAEPAVNLFVTGLQADGDLFQHLHQRFCRHRAPPSTSPKGAWLAVTLRSRFSWCSPPTHWIIAGLVSLRSCQGATVPVFLP